MESIKKKNQWNKFTCIEAAEMDHIRFPLKLILTFCKCEPTLHLKLAGPMDQMYT